MKRNLLVACVASVVVTLPLPLASMSFAAGSVSTVVFHPGFWHFYLKGFLWFLLSELVASCGTLFLTHSRGFKSRA